MLAVHVGERVSHRELIRRVWDDREPTHSTYLKYVRWLRRALTPGGANLMAVESDLRLEMPREAIDVHRFRDLTRRAGAAPTSEEQVELATAALKLCDGTPLNGLSGVWADGVRAGLERERLEMVKLRFRAWLRSGGPTAERTDEYELELSRHGPDDDAVRLLAQALGRIGDVSRAEEVVRRHRVRTERLGASVDPELLWQPRWTGIIQVGLMPLAADGYQERSAWSGPTGDETRYWILSGNAGVGKSQLASRVARRLGEERTVDVVVWVDARSRQSIVAGYAEALRVVSATAEDDAGRASRAFLSWLGSRDQRWLVVLDDVGEVATLNDLWPPETRAGTTIITTRRRDTNLRGHRRTVVEVGEFTEDEARAYLDGKLSSELGPRAGVDRLIERIGRLPIALSQVATYMLDRGLTGDEYVVRVEERGLADTTPERSALPDGQSVRLSGIWRLSIDRADQLDPVGLARPVLELMSMLYTGGVPESLFSTAAVAAYLDGLGVARRPPTTTDGRDATRALERLNLITRVRTDGNRSVQAHALLLEVTRAALPPDRQPAMIRAAADALVEIWPEAERTEPAAALLRANARTLIDHDSPALWSPTPHLLLGRLAQTLGGSGDLAGVREYVDLLLVRSDRVRGPDDLFTLRTRHFAAYWRGQAGEYADAEQQHTAVVGDCRHILGDDHPLTLAAQIYLARWRGLGGRPDEAVRDLGRLIAHLQRVLTADHEDTLTARNDHAYFLGASGHAKEALREFDRLLADRRRILGPRHPHTFVAANDLAYWTLHTGDAAGALQLYDELVPEINDALGQHHPYALGATGNRAIARGENGDASGAAGELTALADKARKILGEQHPITSRTVEYATAWTERARR